MAHQERNNQRFDTGSAGTIDSIHDGSLVDILLIERRRWWQSRRKSRNQSHSSQRVGSDNVFVAHCLHVPNSLMAAKWRDLVINKLNDDLEVCRWFCMWFNVFVFCFVFLVLVVSLNSFYFEFVFCCFFRLCKQWRRPNVHVLTSGVAVGPALIQTWMV